MSVEGQSHGVSVCQVDAGYFVDVEGHEFVAEGDEEVVLVLTVVLLQHFYGMVQGSVGVGEGGVEGEAVQFFYGAFEVVRVDGFEEVVYAVDPEGLQGVFVVGGGEDDWAGDGCLVEDVEGEPVGKMDVEEYDVGDFCFVGS